MSSLYSFNSTFIDDLNNTIVPIDPRIVIVAGYASKERFCRRREEGGGRRRTNKLTHAAHEQRLL
jgi:hypothetical protein